jgi:tRNA A-37 threonylcarbamoyl transferase component Bud32/membrane-associated phospholipid phosphatase
MSPQEAPPAQPPQVADHRRRRPSGEPAPLPGPDLALAGKIWLTLALVVSAVLILLLTPADRGIGSGQWWNDFDAALMEPVIDARSPVLTTIARGLHALGSVWTVAPLVLVAVAVLVTNRRWRHLIVYGVAMLVTMPMVWGIANLIARPRPEGIEILGDWTGFAQPSSPVAVLTVASMGATYALFPAGVWRRAAHVVITVLVGLLALSRVYLGSDRFTDVFSAAVFGVIVPLLLFRIVVPDAVFPVSYSGRKKAHLDLTGLRRTGIIRAIRDQLGMDIVDVDYIGLDLSGGSTPLVLTTADGELVFAKLYAKNHLRADRWYKFGRSVLYGALEDEQSFRAVRRIAEHEDYAARLMWGAGVAVPEPVGLVEITPGREYMLLSSFLDGGHRLTAENCTDEVVRSGLGAIAAMWHTGLAHRDIKPGNVMLVGEQVYLVDHSFDEVCPTPWRQATDLANMMLTLALFVGPERVVEEAAAVFTPDEMAEAFAATHAVTIPTELRERIRESGRDLVGEFRRALPARPPIPIQRWTWRRVATIVGAVVAIVVTIQLVALNVTLLP